MSRTTQERIEDIHIAITRCLHYADDLDASEGYLAAMAMDAIERNIVVVGEARITCQRL